MANSKHVFEVAFPSPAEDEMDVEEEDRESLMGAAKSGQDVDEAH